MPPSRLKRECLLSLPLVAYWAVLFLAAWLTREGSEGHALLVPMLIFGGLPIFIIAARIIVHGVAEQDGDLAYLDDLTGIANRRAFTRDLHDALRWTRPGSLGLLLFDVEGLKQINDRCGHPAGDELLVDVTDHFADAGGKLYRTGGDEFAILVRRSEGGTVMSVAKRLDESYTATLRACGHRHEIRVAYGMTSNHGGDSFEQLYSRADDQLLLHKRALYQRANFDDGRKPEASALDAVATNDHAAPADDPPRKLRLLG